MEEKKDTNQWNKMMIDNLGENGEDFLKAFGKLKVRHMKLNNTNPKINKFLVVLPGLSESSCNKIHDKIDKNIPIYLYKYFTDVYVFDFSTEKIIKINDEWTEIRNNAEDKVKIEKELDDQISGFQTDISYLIDKIIRSFFKETVPKVHLLGKSFGGGIAAFMMNLDTVDYVSDLSLVAPGLSVLEVLKEAKKKVKMVKLAWNQDDAVIKYQESKKFLHQLFYYRIEHRFYSYPEGGHGLHPKFIFEIK